MSKRKLTRNEIRKLVIQELQDHRGRDLDSMSVDELISAGKDKFKHMKDVRARQELIGRLGWEDYTDSLEYMKRMWDMRDIQEIPRKGFHKKEVKNKIVDITHLIMDLMGKDKFVSEILQGLSKQQLKDVVSR